MPEGYGLTLRLIGAEVSDKEICAMARVERKTIAGIRQTLESEVADHESMRRLEGPTGESRESPSEAISLS